MIGRNETAYKWNTQNVHGKLYKINFYVQTECSTSILCENLLIIHFDFKFNKHSLMDFKL